MADNEIGAALRRAQAVYGQRPGAAVHADSAAVARWEGGLRVVTSHPSGRSVTSDMPTEFGGSGEQITPGWYARAGTAACAATCIAIAAQLRGIALTSLEVTVESRSDARGVLGMLAADGTAVEAGATDYRLRVALAGEAAEADLQALALDGCRCSPIGRSMARANNLELQIEITR